MTCPTSALRPLPSSAVHMSWDPVKGSTGRESPWEEDGPWCGVPDDSQPARRHLGLVASVVVKVLRVGLVPALGPTG